MQTGENGLLFDPHKEGDIRNAVRTLLQILEEKGHVKRRPGKGREFIFSPTVKRSRAGIRALEHVLETFYEGSIEKALTAHLVRRKEALTPEDYERMRQLIDEARDQQDHDPQNQT